MAHTMPLIDHLEELRRRLLICLATLAVTVTAAMFKAEAIIDWLKRPAGRHLPLLAFFSPTEALLAYVHVGMAAGIAAALPVLLWQAWGFVRSGLSPAERRYGLVMVLGGTSLFALGAGFAYLAALPLTLQVLLGVGEGTLLPMISVGRYLSFTTSILLAGGLVCELPLVILLLAKLGLVTPQGLRRRWPLAVLAMTVLSALLTPTTDALTMLIMMAPMLALYGLSILIAGRVRPAPLTPLQTP